METFSPELNWDDYVGLAAVLFYLNMQLFFVWLIRRSPVPSSRDFAETAPLPVWVAVRDEEGFLPGLIHSLEGQEVALVAYFGEDGSTDASPQILQEAIQRNPTWQVHEILAEVHQRYPGKQAVLVELERVAKEDRAFFLVADADMVFPPSWAGAMVGGLAQCPELGGTSGPSLPSARGLWSGFQRIETAATLYLIAASQEWGYVPTAIGNSLAIRRAAWQSIGGWKSIAPTLVEDYALKVALEQAGWQFRWIFHPAVLAQTRAAPTLASWIQQRLRWAKAVQTPPPISWLYWTVQMSLPWILAFSGQVLPFLLWVVAEAAPLMRLRQTLQTKQILRYLPLLLLYRFIQGPFYLWLATSRKKITWRGRTYAP